MSIILVPKLLTRFNEIMHVKPWRQCMACRKKEMRLRMVAMLVLTLIPNKVHRPNSKSNTETPRFTAEKRFLQQVRRSENNLRFASPKAKGLRYL